MKTNILRLNRKSILDDFVISFYATEASKGCYTKASLPQSWINTSKVEKIDAPDYEETLSTFFGEKAKEVQSHPLLVILGGIGTGKSSTIKYALSQSKICESCHFNKACDKNFPERILVDFINFKTTVDSQTPDVVKPYERKKLEQKFWYHILNILDVVIDDEMDTKTEISEFWSWLFEQKSVEIPLSLYKKLFPKKRLFSDYNDNSSELLDLKDQLFDHLSTKELTLYKLFQIGYLRKDQKANCNFIIFDNIDTLAPFLQSELVNFSLEAHRLLNCRAIIPLRPHTLTTNKDASDFFEIMPHWKPSLLKVFDIRLKMFKSKGDSDTYTALKLLIDTIKSSKVFTSFFIGTSGKSIRYALRNFYNFCLSPLIVTHIDGKVQEDLGLDLNTFFQAYLCSENKSETLDEDNFQNILSIRKSQNQSYLSSLKLRFLHLLYTNDSIRLGKLYKLLIQFGYEKFEIISVLNEFLDNKKAICWSSNLHQYSKKDLKVGDSHILRISHLGANYYEKVISEPMYLRECIISISTKRYKGKRANLSIVMDYLKQLEEFDYTETSAFVKKNGAAAYRKVYPQQEVSISHILWSKVRDSLKYWTTLDSNFVFDYNRDRYISRTINSYIQTKS